MTDHDLVLGINVGRTSFGLELRNGGTCILKDGEVEIALAEERVTRRKADSGFKESLKYCLNKLDYELADFDIIVYSSCVDKQGGCPPELSVDKSKIKSVSHHLSHARSAYNVSGFDEAIIGIFDAGGDILDGENPAEWWKCEREQQSYYIAKGNNNIELLHRDFSDPYEAGIGEIYRAFTHYLGFGSHIHSGKTMGLAAYGDSTRFTPELFYFDGINMKSKIENDPKNPIEMVERFANQQNIDAWEQRNRNEEIKDIHKDIAAYLQREVESALVAKFQKLFNRHHINSVASAGGVALNCVANKKILTNTSFKKMFIQPAAGDQGQCLGNALHGHHKILGKDESFVMQSPYFGNCYNLMNDSNLISQIKDDGFDIFHPKEESQLYERAANFLANGNIIGVFQGSSEFGPRALGHRSILADPRKDDINRKLNKIKSRKEFRPYAPSVIREFTSDWFTEDWYSDSSNIDQKLSLYMIIISSIQSNKRDKIPAVVHKNGTARLQEVDQSISPRYYRLLEQFRQKTGVPVVLNTSFNRGGEPIVETPSDAYDCFVNTPIDCLLLEDFLIY